MNAIALMGLLAFPTMVAGAEWCYWIETNELACSQGYLTIYVRDGYSGDYEYVKGSDRLYAGGEEVFKKCFSEGTLLQVLNSNQDGWGGSIKFSNDGGKKYEYAACTDGCTGDHMYELDEMLADGNNDPCDWADNLATARCIDGATRHTDDAVSDRCTIGPLVTTTTVTATTTTMTSTTTTNYIDVTCEIGQFVEGDEDDADYKECKPCPKNTFMDESKASTQICLDQTKCKAGEKIDADSKVKARECTACADGYYNRGGGMSKKSHRGTMCTAQATCPPGEQHQDTSASEWTSTKLKCFGCPGGKFNPGNNDAEVSTGNCMPFKQAPCVTSSGEYELRAPSKIADRVCGSTGPCDTDTEYEANPDRGPFEERECSTLTTCAPGYKVKVQSTKTTDRTCVLCDANTYQDAVDHVETECKEHVACNKGQYAVKTDAEIANEPVVAARECTKCPSGTYQRKSGFETACTNQKGCGPGQRTTADSFNKPNKCTSCRVSADECPTTQYPEASACVSTYQPDSKYRFPQCLPNLVTSCGINEYMLNRQSLIAPQRCMPCVQKGDGTGGVGEGGYMDLDSHSFSECIAFSTHTSSATSTATTTPTTTGTTTPFSTATTTPTTTVTTGANFNLVIFSVKNGNANDGFLFDTLLAGRERTGSFEQAVKAAYPGVLRIDHLAPGMDNAWLTPRICKEGRENCFKCGPISIVSPLTGNACMRCKDSTYLHQGECVSNCPAKFNGEGQGLFDRRCIEETGNKAPKARSGIVATLVFEDAAVMEQFESDTAGCLGSMCIEFEETTLCPRTRDMAACAEAAASASSIGMIAGGAGGFLVLLIMVVLIARSGGSKGDDEGYGGYEGASYEGTGAGQVVAFENPMYANGEGGDDDDSGEEGEGMYDEPESFGGPQADAEEGGGLYDEPEMIADGDDDNGDAGYLDVAGDDEEPAASSEEEEEEEAGEDDEEDDE